MSALGWVGWGFALYATIGWALSETIRIKLGQLVLEGIDAIERGAEPRRVLEILRRAAKL